MRTTWEPAGADFVPIPQRLAPARVDLLDAEKEFTRQRDALTRRRMAMPWERVEKSYQFDGPWGALKRRPDASMLDPSPNSKGAGKRLLRCAG